MQLQRRDIVSSTGVRVGNISQVMSGRDQKAFHPGAANSDNAFYFLCS